MASKTALSPPSQSVSAQKDRRSTSILDLPLEVRIMIYTEIVTRPENHYIIDQSHHQGKLPGIIRAHPQVTREIYQFCTITTIFKPGVLQTRTSSIFSYLSIREAYDTAEKVIRFNAQANHREAMLTIMLKCWRPDCLQGSCCVACRVYAEHVLISPIAELGLEERLIIIL